ARLDGGDGMARGDGGAGAPRPGLLSDGGESRGAVPLREGPAGLPRRARPRPTCAQLVRPGRRRGDVVVSDRSPRPARGGGASGRARPAVQPLPHRGGGGLCSRAAPRLRNRRRAGRAQAGPRAARSKDAHARGGPRPRARGTRAAAAARRRARAPGTGPLTPTLLHDILDEQARRSPDRTAVSKDGVCWTYERLCPVSHAYAEWLGRHGVGRGDRLLVLAPRALGTVAAVY